ncbi:nuclear transport factor 2 family protein [Klebsiella pneumoniae]|uniref:nuclear transport factor 2 family protein n=1 Tax=Klebsiella pneumoniae TaxID=573 RepID=UPI001BAC49FF|nr:nuclear transport factor 2 family protein [Klebsiella pneumoniae]MBQ5265199.1 nuclear transport factor 2 family protein [Klebsiella pneumoniae]
MCIETNKQIARAYFAALIACDTQTMGEYMTDDATWWVSAGTKFSGQHNKADFLGRIPGLFADSLGRIDLEFFEITAEDNRVNVIAKGNLQFNDGRVYASNYSFLLTFRDGKISSGKEFLDAAHVNEIFGAP